MNTPKATDVLDNLVNSTYWTKEPVEEKLASETDRKTFVRGHIDQAAAHLYRDLINLPVMQSESVISTSAKYEENKKYWRNQFRAELRTDLAAYFGIEEGEV